MLCPFCKAENIENRDKCYNCDKDLSMLRLIINKSRHHYNVALEHAERGRYYEAIMELNNVLELDYKNVNAHVVLGTIYAKQNQYEKAIECWETALNIDNKYKKAHDYIIKAGHIKDSLPLLKWLKILAGVIIGCIVIIIAIVLMFNTPDPQEKFIKEAYSNYKANNLSATVKSLEKVKESQKNQSVNISKNLLENALSNEIKMYKTEIQLAQADGKPYEAVKLLQELKSKMPDEETVSWIESNEKNIIISLVARITKDLEEFKKNDTDPQELAQAIEAFKKIFPDQKEGTEFDSVLQETLKTRLVSNLDSIFSKFDETGEPDAAYSSIQELSDKYNKFGSFDEIIDPYKQKIAKEEIEKAIKLSAKLLESQDFDKAQAKIDEVKARKEIQKEQMAKLLELNAKIQTERTNKLLADIRDSFKNNKYETVIELADKALAIKLIEQDQEEISNIRSKSISSLVSLKIRLYDKLDGAFEECRQTDDQSKQLLKDYDFLMENMSKKTYSYFFDNLVFYAASANFKLGNFEEAEKFVERLEQEYPKSPFIKSVKKVRTRAEIIHNKN